MKFFAFAFCAFAFAFAIAFAIPIEEEKKICEPGTHEKVDCNNCICSADGKARACTMMMCPKMKVDLARTRRDTKICEPSTRYKKFCNKCSCNNDGTEEACTRMACPPNIWNADGTLKNAETVTNNPLLRQ